jgi:AGZA family xanthine/uracil permease-like MFS transporter
MKEAAMGSDDRIAKPEDRSERRSLLFVNGTLMRGLALHGNLDGGEFLEEARTAARYRLHSIGDRHPGMFEVESGGVTVIGELYRLTDEVLERVISGEPRGLFVGSVELSDGRVVPGVLFDPERLDPADRDISAHGGWRAYIASSTAHR